MRRASGDRSLSFFSVKSALTHHPKGQWYFLRKSCALRGGCGSYGSLMSNATSHPCCCHWPRSRLIVSLHSKTRCRTKTFCTHAACPHKAATGSFICGYGYRLPQYPFSFCEKETNTRAKGRGKQMAIYHLEAKVVSRGTGRSAVAAAAYLSCSKILNDYDGIQHDYTRKKGLVWQEVFLPKFAPSEWKDRGVLWNAVEENEKTKDSRLAREFVPALPIELTPAQWQELLSDFIKESFVADGMCADVAIHDPYPPGHNPHAHIMLTVRPLDEQGQWQYKTEKEYLCVKDGEERGFTAAEFKTAQKDGWEKQYPYKVGRKKVYMPPSEAEKYGYERASKHPQSAKYGRQNPITERWNSEEQ